MIMGWIQDHLRQESHQSSPTGSDPEGHFTAAARQRWLQLGEELRSDVAEFSSQHPGADFTGEGDNRYLVSNPEAGLELRLTADFDNHTVRYGYSAINDKSAGVPEGGMLSMRQTRSGAVEFYSADERLTSEEARQVLLQPILFPQKAT
jgi:hypothetical protein